MTSRITVFTFRGTGEPRNPGGEPTGLIGEMFKGLNPDEFVGYEVPWPAQVGPAGDDLFGYSLEDSVDMGVLNGKQVIRTAHERGEKFAIAGYSLGAIVATRLFEECAMGQINNDLEDPIRPEFLLNFASPLRLRGESVNNVVRPDLHGLHGERMRLAGYGVPVYEYADPLDCITASAPNSPLRFINDVISPISLKPPYQLQLGDIIRVLDGIKERELMDHWWDAAWWQKWADAFRGATGYLTPYPYGDHVSYNLRKIPSQNGTDFTYTQHAAWTLMENH